MIRPDIVLLDVCMVMKCPLFHIWLKLFIHVLLSSPWTLASSPEADLLIKKANTLRSQLPSRTSQSDNINSWQADVYLDLAVTLQVGSRRNSRHTLMEICML